MSGALRPGGGSAAPASVAAGDITDVGAVGEALVQAETAAEARTTLGLARREPGLDPVPLLWWKTDEAPGATACANSGSASSANLSLTNAFPGALGPWGEGAVQTGGGGGYALAPVNKGQPSAAISICLWFRQTAAAGARLMMRSYGPTWSAPYTSVDLFVDSGGKLVGGIAGAGSERRPSAGSVPVVARPGEWHHAALTYDGTTGRVYLDGAEVVTFSYSGAVDYHDPTLTRWCVGGNNLASEPIVGEWADPRVYAAALSAAKVAEIHARGRGLGPP